MVIRLEFGAEATASLKAMAAEASLTPMELAEIGVYNLIALWMEKHGMAGQGIEEVATAIDFGNPTN